MRRHRLRRLARSRRCGGADAVVLVTEWQRVRGARLDAGRRRDERRPRDRRAQRARPGRRARGRPGLRGDRKAVSASQAVILVGGEGTRLRPLTSTVPKPVVPLVDRPFISFMLEWLREHGIDDVIMSCGFLADERAQRARRRIGPRHPPALRRGARSARHGRRAEARRADARRALPDAQRRRAHRHRPDARRSPSTSRPARGRRSRSCRSPTRPPTASCSCTRTARCGTSSRSRAPTASTRNLISAGAYVLEREILELVPPDRNVSIEREVWPLLVGDGLYGFPSESYWLDIGTPERYLQGTFDIIEGNVAHRGARAPRQRLAGVDDERRGARAGDPAGGDRARRARRRGRARRQPRRCSRDDVSIGAGSDGRARGDPQRRRRSARAASCATASSRPAVASARARRSPAARCSARA